MYKTLKYKLCLIECLTFMDSGNISSCTEGAAVFSMKKSLRALHTLVHVACLANISFTVHLLTNCFRFPLAITRTTMVIQILLLTRATLPGVEPGNSKFLSRRISLPLHTNGTLDPSWFLQHQNFIWSFFFSHMHLHRLTLWGTNAHLWESQWDTSESSEQGYNK